MGPYGITGSATYAVPIINIGGMLTVLPDNTANQINAQNVRDVVSGLYDLIEGVSQSVAGLTVSYTNANPSTLTVGGITQGTTFNAVPVQTVFTYLLYPYVAPTYSISANPNVIEFGNTSQTVTLSWSISAKKNNILSASIIRPLQSTVIITPPTAFTSTANTVASCQVVANTTTTFTFSISDLNVGDGTGGATTSNASVTWSLKRYWGAVASGHALATTSTASVTYANISGLSSELNSSYVMTKTITANNEYVVFVWPSSNGVDLTTLPPNVSILGFGNNDWTRTRSGVTLTNQYGYTASYDVWRFNHLQSNTLQYVIS